MIFLDFHTSDDVPGGMIQFFEVNIPSVPTHVIGMQILKKFHYFLILILYSRVSVRVLLLIVRVVRFSFS